MTDDIDSCNLRDSQLEIHKSRWGIGIFRPLGSVLAETPNISGTALRPAEVIRNRAGQLGHSFSPMCWGSIHEMDWRKAQPLIGTPDPRSKSDLPSRQGADSFVGRLRLRRSYRRKLARRRLQSYWCRASQRPTSRSCSLKRGSARWARWSRPARVLGLVNAYI